MTQAGASTLPQRYRAAFASYATDWVHVDAELIKVIQSHNSGSFPDVHLRVVLMNGVYRAQLNGLSAPTLIIERHTRSIRTGHL